MIADRLRESFPHSLVADLEAAGQQLLEDALGVVLARDIKEAGLVGGAVAGVDLLEAGGVAHVVESIEKAGGLGGGVDGVGRLLGPCKDGVVVLAADPLDDLGPGQVGALGRRVDAQRVAAGVGALRARRPQRRDGLPVDADEAEVLGGDLGVQLGQGREEDVVGDLDALEQAVVVFAHRGAGDEEVVDVVDDEAAVLDGEVGQRLEGARVGHGRDGQELLETLRLGLGRAVVEEDDGGDGGVGGGGDSHGHDVGLGVGVGGGEVGNGLQGYVVCQSYGSTFQVPSGCTGFTNLEELIQMLARDGVGTGPDLGRGEGAQLELGHDAEVAAAALEGPEEVGVLGGGGLGDGAVGEDDLVLDDVVRRPAVLVAVEVDAAAQEEAGDADGRETAAGDGQVVRLQEAEDVAPAVGGADAQDALVGVELQGGQVGHDHQDAVVDAVGTLSHADL